MQSNPVDLDARARRVRPWIALASLLATLALAEVAFRVDAARRNRATFERAFRDLEPPPPGAPARLIDIIQPSANDLRVYELRPNLRGVSFKGAAVSTNGHGFRSRELPLAADADTWTIVGIGDSIMFGHGVEDDQTYLAVLERLLAQGAPARRARVVNTGVPGYTTRMEVATLRERGLAFRPDLVILNVVANDFAPPSYVRVEDDPWSASRSFLCEWVAARVGARAARPAGELVHTDELGSPYEDEIERVPERYRGVVGAAAFETALDELLELSREHRFEVLVFTTYDFGPTHEMLASAERRGFACATLMPTLERWFADRGQTLNETNYRASELVVGPENAHPSALQHRMVAKELLSTLRSIGTLERMAAR